MNKIYRMFCVYPVYPCKDIPMVRVKEHSRWRTGTRPRRGPAWWVVLGLSLFAGVGPVLAEDSGMIGFQRLEHPGGPSHNSIFALLQDHRGFLWVGTQDGLDRWDGVRFETYRHDPDDPGSMAANRVPALLEDSSRRLWVVTAAGVDVLDRATGIFEHTQPPDPASDHPWRVSTILEPNPGVVLAGGISGLYRRDEIAKAWRRIHPQIETVEAMHSGSDGILWILEMFEPERPRRLWRIPPSGSARAWSLEGHAPGGVHDFFVDPTGRVWLDPSGPVVVDQRSDTIALPWGSMDPAVWPLSFRQGADGTLWIGTSYGGIVRQRLNTSTWAPAGAAQTITISQRRLANWAGALLIDATGILWVGTEDGLYRHDPNLKPFRHWGRERPGRLPPVSVSAISDASGGGWWVGTFGDGLFRLAADGRVQEHIDADDGGLPDGMVWSLNMNEEQLLVGLDDGTLCRDGIYSHPRQFHCPKVPVDRIGHIVPAFDRLWLAAQDGLVLLDADGNGPEVFPRRSGRLAERDLIVVVPTSEDRAFVGTWAGELLRFDRRHGEFEIVAREPELRAPILDLHDDRDGNLWIAHGDGLARYNSAENVLERIPLSPSAPGSNAYSILEDHRDRLWLGTNRGLVRYDPQAPAGQKLRHYGMTDGLENREFNRNARFRAEGGRLLLFGGERGITHFRPERIGNNPHPPPVRVLAAEIGGPDGRRKIPAWSLEQLQLSPGEDTFELEVAALSFTEPAQNRYRYILEGYDNRWVESGQVREIRYSHLPAGDYVLRVQAANNDVVWNRTGLSLPVHVAPPFWQTWWFRLLVAVLVMLALYGIHRLRLQRAVETERLRLRIASDLHDQLSSDLSGIALTTDLVRRRATLNEHDGGRLERVRDQALQSLRSLRDIVWYVDPARDALTGIGDRMREVAEDLLADRELRCEIRLPDKATAPMLWRRELFLAYKEILHNVARHSRAARVEISLSLQGTILQLRVADDGIGFDPDSGHDGTGLASLKRRARVLDGNLEICSTPGGGTNVVLEAPLPGRRT